MPDNFEYHCQEPRAKSKEPNSALKILVCYHKPYTMPPLNDGILLPIQVGKSLTDIDLHIQADNEVNGQPCDNISDKNATHNEMTAIYWAWKNLRKLYPDVKYVGLFHYRRFLAFNESKFFETNINKLESDIVNYKIDAEKIINILKSGKIILPKRSIFPCSVFMHYCVFHFSGDYFFTKDIIRDKFPDYYADFINVMEHSNRLHPANIFIMKYDDFTKYCEWIFDVVKVIEPEIQKNHSESQKRLFMSERLFNVYVRKNKMQAKYFNVYFYGEHSEPKRLTKKFLAYITRLVKYLIRMAIMSLTNLNLFSRNENPPKP